jgi:hypothetical protein
MAGIIYTTNKSGDRVGRWSGKSYRDENGKPQKTGQLYLGKVIDEERLIFFKKEVGYYVFNPDDKSGRPVTTGDVPVVRTSPDRREHTPKGCLQNNLDKLIENSVAIRTYSRQFDTAYFLRR